MRQGAEDVIILPDYPSVVINIGTIKVTTIENTSSLNIGRNYLREFWSENKTNQGLGSILGGNNSFPYNTNLVDDPDVLDMHCGSGSKKLAGGIKELLPAGTGHPPTAGQAGVPSVPE